MPDGEVPDQPEGRQVTEALGGRPVAPLSDQERVERERVRNLIRGPASGVRHGGSSSVRVICGCSGAGGARGHRVVRRRQGNRRVGRPTPHGSVRSATGGLHRRAASGAGGGTRAGPARLPGSVTVSATPRCVGRRSGYGSRGAKCSQRGLSRFVALDSAAQQPELGPSSIVKGSHNPWAVGSSPTWPHSASSGLILSRSSASSASAFVRLCRARQGLHAARQSP
jgi:hypothetical protein